MKRGLTILTAALFAGALAMPAMAQSTDSGADQQAPAAVTNPVAANAGNPAASADDAAKPESGEMKQEQRPADDASAQPSTSDDQSNTNPTTDAGANPAGNTAPEHGVE
jgi:hypothetical protein